jgi:hypothetical protein
VLSASLSPMLACVFSVMQWPLDASHVLRVSLMDMAPRFGGRHVSDILNF